MTFWGNKLHGTEDYKGSRVVQIGYMPRNWDTLSDADPGTLGDLGFRVPGEGRSKAHSLNLQQPPGPARSPNVQETQGPAGSPNIHSNLKPDPP